MSTSTLTRLGSLSIFLTAILFLASGAALAAGSDPTLGSPTATLLFYASLVIAVFAFTTIYTNAAQELGRLGFIGYLLSTAGIVLYSAPAFVLVAGSNGIQTWHDLWFYAMGNILLIGPPLFLIGLILLGSAIWRSDAYPHWTGFLTTAGAVLWLVAFFLSITLLLIAALLLVTISLSGIALSLTGTKYARKLKGGGVTS